MKRITLLTSCLALFAAGCANESTPGTTEPPIDGSAYLLSEEPEGAQEIIAARESTANGDNVTIVGRIGGGENPWIDGQAAFMLVDNSIKACSDIPGDKCPTPWDYCCETPKLPASSAYVEVVDDNGDLVNADARQLLGVTELSTVVVQGKAKRDDAGNLTVLARHIYVKK